MGKVSGPGDTVVKVTLLRSAFSVEEGAENQFLTSYLVNESVAVDAGCVGLMAETQRQVLVKHIFLSHSHIDHIASLPIFVENAYEAKRDCVVVYGSQAVLDCLRTDIFNNRVWPDFIALSSEEAPFLKLSMIESGKPVCVDGLTVTPVGVDHVVPTLGFIVSDGKVAVAIVSDTGPTEEIWRYVNSTPEVKAVFLEVTFPDSLAQLATISKHLTPATLAGEVRKLQRQIPVFAVHLKARYFPQIVAELQTLGLNQIQIVQFGHEYEF